MLAFVELHRIDGDKRLGLMSEDYPVFTEEQAMAAKAKLLVRKQASRATSAMNMVRVRVSVCPCVRVSVCPCLCVGLYVCCGLVLCVRVKDKHTDGV